jgi:hypothetical protein
MPAPKVLMLNSYYSPHRLHTFTVAHLHNLSDRSLEVLCQQCLATKTNSLKRMFQI